MLVRKITKGLIDLTSIFFVRHAQPVHSHEDDRTRPLSMGGIADSKKVTEFLSRFSIDFFISSPYKRSMDTISESAKMANMKIHTDERLRERQKGDDGNNHGLFRKRWADFNFHEQGGESLAIVQKRNMDALFDILANHKNKNVVVGTHGTALSTILNYYNPSFACDDFLRIIDFMPYIVRLDFDGETYIQQEELLVVEKEFVGTNRADKPNNVIIVALKAIIVFNGKALIIQRSSDDEVGADTWEFVGGRLDFGEDLEVALKREIHEEAGLNVMVDKLLYAATFKTHEYRQMVILAYLCTATNDKVVLSTEHQNYLWANKKQILEMLPKPLITNMNQHDVWCNANIE